MSDPPLQARHGRGEFFFWLSLCVCVQHKTERKQQMFVFLIHRQILSHWDEPPLELRQMIQWMGDRQLKRGWKKYTVKASKTFANFFKFNCNQETSQTSRALIYPSDIVDKVTFVLIV